ncbi:MAG: cobamide remodeling phosphodiesterase CbiR [Synergistaceae bacterium]|nr:cobamide remodeling phosphodiesterase CbiR [Synergistaceae bacterium]
MRRLNFPGVRLGGTSWVVNGGFADNMRALSGEVSDMMFVLFDNEYGSNIPSKAEIRELAALRRELDMSCTVHFPDDICLSGCVKDDDAERIRCEDSCIRMMELFAPLEPFAYITHLDGDQYGDAPCQDMELWLEKTLRSVLRVAAAAGDDRKKICAETLDYSIELAEPVISECGISICLDIGHLVRYKRGVREHLSRFLPRTRTLHIHGVDGEGTDHLDMSYFDMELFDHIINELAKDGAERVMTLEVFEEDYRRSIEALKKRK